MHKITNVQIGTDILKANLSIAHEISEELKAHGIKSYEFMGAVGSGKTLIIERLIERLKAKGVRCAVIAGDVSGNDDYLRFIARGAQAVNVNTGKECHLDAHYIQHALEHLDLHSIDVLFIENVGNLVCPSDFPLGADMRIVVISTTEGDDMVRKHPVIFANADLAVLNKKDLAGYVDVDPNVVISDYKRIVPHKKILLTDAKHGEGIDELMKEMGLMRE
ncbi:MAG: hydrogenase nickel incorporation protein HypB [Thermoplasmata archaeon]|nr:hydrogenase nickel incorporation protein HypB [Thermoplasmata archaeon]